MQLFDETLANPVFENEEPTGQMVSARMLAWVGKGALAITDQGLLSGSNFLLGVLLARWLTLNQYGAFALGFSIFLFLSGLHNAFFLEPMSVLGPESHADCLPGYIRKLLRLHFVFAFLLSMLTVAAIPFLRFFAAGQAMASTLWGVAVAVPLILFQWLCRRAAYLRLASGLAAASSAAYCVALVLLLLVFNKQGWLSPFTGFLIPSLATLPAILMLLMFLPRGTNSPPAPSNAEIVRRHWRYGRWVVGGTTANWLSANAYYFIVAALLPMRDLAAFRALRNFTSPCAQALVAINLLVLPWASARFAKEGIPGLRRRTRQLAWLFGAAALAYLAAIWFLGSKVMNFLYAGRYNDFSTLLLLSTAPLLFTATAMGSEVAVQVMQAPSEVFLAYSVSGALTVLTGVVFTRYWGLAGGLVGLLISAIAFWVVITYRYHKRLRAANLPPKQKTGVNRGDESVAWLMPNVAGAYYWQPVFKEFTALVPKTVIFAGSWPGSLPQYRGTFQVRPVRSVRFIAFGKGGPGYPRGFTLALPTILWQLGRLRPSVVLTSGLNLWSAFTLLFKRITKCRVVLIWEGVSPSIAGLNSPWRLAVRRMMAKEFDAAISNTRAGVQYLRDVLGMPSDRVVHHPIEVAEAPALKPANGDLPVNRHDASFAFLVVGQLIERKGIHRLFEAARLLQNRGRHDFSIHIVGTGEMAGILQRQIAGSPLDKVVRWIGPVSYEKLGECYEACDAVVFPSLEDTWGMVVLEAMCLGRPVLCSRYAGSKEMIHDGENGFVFDPHNPEELADRMELFLRVPGLAQRLGEKAKESISPYTARLAAQVLAQLAAGCGRLDSPPVASEDPQGAFQRQ
jgi:glycosyltransferase involved in cell wall biosynthesis